MHRILAGVLAGIMFAAPVAPAAAGPGKARPAAAAADPEELRRFEAALPKLALTAEQKPRIAALLKDVRASLRKIEQSAGNTQQKEQRRKALHKSAQSRLDTILTVHQARKLKGLMDAPHGAARKPH